MHDEPASAQHYGLTKNQYYCLCVIQELTAAQGFAPSLTEIGHEMDIKGRNRVHMLVKGLIERGYLAQIPRRRRSLRVIRPVALPDFSDVWDGVAFVAPLKKAAPSPDAASGSTPTPALPHHQPSPEGFGLAGEGGGENAGKPG